MVNIRNLLLALLPVASAQPPAIFVLPTAIPAVVSDDGTNNITDVLQVLTIQVAEEHRSYERAKLRASPEIGGQRITKEWLHSLQDRDCVWRFR